MRFFHVAALSIFALAGLACSASSPTSSDHDASQSGAGDAVTGNIYFTPKGVDTTRVYFGTDNLLAISDATPVVYALVDITPKSKVTFDLTQADGSATSVGFKLLHVTSTGKLTLIATEDGPNGEAKHTLNANAGGTYVVEVGSNGQATTLKLDLGCSNSTTHCAPKNQVGEICGGIAGFQCDTGLDCAFAPGLCHVADAAGTCALPTHFCPEIFMPVCGCDGKTYTNACFAGVAGAAIDHTGACVCDPTVYNVVTPAVSADVQGSFSFSNHVGTSVIRGSLTINADGTFSETITRGPFCEAGHPCPYYVVLVGQASGTYKVGASGVVLKANKSQSSGTYPTTLVEETNCAGDVHLVANENGVDEVFAH